jgi:hypothetical protein
MFLSPTQQLQKVEKMFLNSLNDWITAMEFEIQTLPRDLDSVFERLDRNQLQNIRSRLEQEFDLFIDKQIAAQNQGEIILPYIVELPSMRTRRITQEDLSKRREVYKSAVRVVIAKGMVQLLPVSEIADKLGTTISQITTAAQRKGYIVLSWDQYQRLWDEIGKLIN